MTTRLDILFQSTRPSRGETTISARLRRHSIFQSTRPSRGETRLSAPVRPARRFQSTRPSRGETQRRFAKMLSSVISIHSPLAGRDGPSHSFASSASYFNPLAPRGARRSPRIQPAWWPFISIHSPLAGRDSKIAENHARDYCNSHNQPLEHG